MPSKQALLLFISLSKANFSLQKIGVERKINAFSGSKGDFSEFQALNQ